MVGCHESDNLTLPEYHNVTIGPLALDTISKRT
jgi:hypothetical protein